ncbi:hypothetical protein BJ508DRAFT_323404 [Ascobolus immersus RN42]|uniref:Uncharacterized protein n=1 Tax=Ascobolus immersus RN42 TaxID=1160509 RepID=A0A3N4IFC0_ASCIM|nr:hypothetical protein BJ508DRAFT_323404 [Ascobolus immersus RN42]
MPPKPSPEADTSRDVTKKRPASPTEPAASRTPSAIQPVTKRPRQTKLQPSVQVQIERKPQATPGTVELAEALAQLPAAKVMSLLNMVEKMKRPNGPAALASEMPSMDGAAESGNTDAGKGVDNVESENAGESRSDNAVSEWSPTDDEFQGSAQLETPDVAVKREPDEAVDELPVPSPKKPLPEAPRRQTSSVATPKDRVNKGSRAPARLPRSRQPKAIRINAEVVQSLLLNLSRVLAKFGGEEGSRASDPLGVDDDDDAEEDSEGEEPARAPKKRPSTSSAAIRAVVFTVAEILALPWRATWPESKVASYDPTKRNFSDSAQGAFVRARDGFAMLTEDGKECDRCVSGANCPFVGCLFLSDEDARCANCAWNGQSCKFEN